jgi:hypothetical protein
VLDAYGIAGGVTAMDARKVRAHSDAEKVFARAK